MMFLPVSQNQALEGTFYRQWLISIFILQLEKACKKDVMHYSHYATLISLGLLIQ